MDGSGSGSQKGSGAGEMLADDGWLAALATGDSTRTTLSSNLQSTLITAATTAVVLFFLYL